MENGLNLLKLVYIRLEIFKILALVLPYVLKVISFGFWKCSISVRYVMCQKDVYWVGNGVFTLKNKNHLIYGLSSNINLNYFFFGF